MEKFRNKWTGAILIPASDMVAEQMKKSPDFEIVDDRPDAGEKAAPKKKSAKK